MGSEVRSRSLNSGRGSVAEETSLVSRDGRQGTSKSTISRSSLTHRVRNGTAFQSEGGRIILSFLGELLESMIR